MRFLLSDHARYITGQTLVVDGGVTLQAPGARQSDALKRRIRSMARVPYLDKSDLAPENQELLARNIMLHRALAQQP